MKKNIFRSIFICLLVIMFSSSNICALALNDFIEEERIVENISEIIADFYYNKDVKGETDLDSVFGNDIAVYLTDKINAQQFVTELYDTQKENYDVDVILKSKTDLDDENLVLYQFQVIATYNYEDCDFETTSSDLVQIIYDCDNNEIIDFYTPNDYYDEYIRGDDDIDDVSNTETFQLTSKISRKQKNIIEEILSTYAQLTADDENVQLQNVESAQSARSATLDRDAIVSWARKNYNKATPSSGNGTVPYYDFSK